MIPAVDVLFFIDTDVDAASRVEVLLRDLIPAVVFGPDELPAETTSATDDELARLNVFAIDELLMP